ncbi:tRNA-dihydrouridine synthase family protein [Candidatus Pacearchaeota archaeon]|nr:tRNA-dihydrouridine synthase family protein [Candidatus Pacearchaeota archaeon]
MQPKIGNLGLKNRFLLAPMLEPNDIAFRLLCKKAGCGLTYTGMISPLSKRKLDLDDRPALQLFGNSARGIRSFMKKYDSKVSLWDFNLGCPSKLSKKIGHGAFMHENLIEIERILRVMRESTVKPVTIKIRKSKIALKIARMAERIGVDAIGIHARTISQGYSGEVDYDFALEVKGAVAIPVIFSGNVDETNVERILRDFDFVFVGRAAIGDPAIFSRLLKGRESVECKRLSDFGEYLKLAKKYGLFFRQIKYQAMNFTKGMRQAKRIRKRLVGVENIEEIEKIGEIFA